MNAILQTAETQIDSETGFRYRMVSLNNENSVLHNHDYYELFLTLSPKLLHLVNNHEEILLRGALVFIRKEDVHYYQPTSTDKIAFINIAFTEDLIKELFAFLSAGFCSKELLNAASPPTVHISEDDIAWLLRQFEELNTTPHDKIDLLKYRLRVLLFKIFTRYFQNYNQIITGDSQHIPIWLIQLDDKMSRLENFSQPLQHMVELSGKTRTHLGRILKQYYGTTITQYIYEKRLIYFANSLITTDHTVTDICFECGFENLSWAYELFKQKFGTTPLHFRKNSTQKQADGDDELL